jgi:phage gp36-like protein
MAYSTDTQVRIVLIGRRSEDRNETVNELDGDQIENAITDADAQIDLALRRRYLLPLQEPIPNIINALSINIATYLASLTFRSTTPVDSNDPTVLRYERARRLLEDIRNGRVDLGVLERVTEESGTDSVFNMLEYPLFPTHPWFGEENAEGVIPPDRLYRRTF